MYCNVAVAPDERSVLLHGFSGSVVVPPPLVGVQPGWHPSCTDPFVATGVLPQGGGVLLPPPPLPPPEPPVPPGDFIYLFLK